MFVADTHALVRYLLGNLPSKADEVFRSSERGEVVIFIPTIVLAECYYLIKDSRIQLNFDEVINKIESSDNFISVSFNLEIVKLLTKSKIKEIHDQIIVATAKHLKAKVITKDENIKRSGEIEVVWD